jgi:hypothetical protein
MAISLNPLDLIKMFHERGIHDRELVVEYVQKIADSASELADLWCETIAAIPAPQPVVRPFGRQTYLCTQIEYFYKDASKVIAGRINPEQRDRLYEVLGLFMENRNQTTRIHCDAMRIFLARENEADPLEILEQARRLANQLQANAAALQALASEIRAMK